MHLRIQKNLDYFILFFVFFQLVVLKFNGREQIGNKMLLLLIAVSLLKYFHHYKKNQGGIILFALVIVMFISNIICLGGNLGNIKSNFIMLVYPIASLFFIEHFVRRYSTQVTNLFKNTFWVINGYFLLNVIVLIIQLRGTGFMVGINAAGTVNPMYGDLIAGLLGYSGTHQLSLFMSFVILYNIVYWKNKVNPVYKTALLLYIVGCVVFCSYISIENYNQAFFFILPLAILLLIISTGLDVRNLKLSWHIVRRFILIGVLAFIAGAYLYNTNSAIQNFINVNVLDMMNMATNAMKMGLNANGSDERFAMILYGLNNLNGWKIGNGLGNYFIYQGGALGFRHFGQASLGTLICLGGIWFAVILICLFSYQLTKTVFGKVTAICFIIIGVYYVFLFVYCQVAYDNIVCLWSIIAVLPIRFAMDMKREQHRRERK